MTNQGHVAVDPNTLLIAAERILVLVAENAELRATLAAVTERLAKIEGLDRKIAAVRAYREKYGCGLKEAKEAVESAMQHADKVDGVK